MYNQRMKRKPFEPLGDGRESERFETIARQLLSVPKKDIDKKLAEERKKKTQKKIK